ncbi:LexA family protein [Candidatus Francisella endociliophora]|uniref:LexA family protein n=1 Tax=Candidatus Francisella endociliophora TaxID=653937 RepID=UPI0006937BFC|nr:XRE family transcriptional regulator [Francisella sp. FSC1006]
MNKNMRDVKHLIKDSGISQSELARKLGISRASVNAWVKGIQSPTLKRYKELLKVLDIKEDASKDDLYNLSKEAQPIRYAPVLDYIQAGHFSGVSNLPDGIEHAIVPESVDLDPENDFILKVRGDSMYNPSNRKSLNPDELVVVDTKKCPNIGDVVVAYVTGACEATIKLVTGEVGNMYLEPLNEKYLGRDGFVIPKDDEVHIKGVVKAVIPPIRKFIS